MNGGFFAHGSFTRRLLTRAVVVLGAVLVGGQVMRSLPREQTLIFPVGSAFPNATRFVASWRHAGEDHAEPEGGVTLGFTSPPPLQIRQQVKVPNGDYIVAIEIESAVSAESHHRAAENSRHPETATPSERLQTNIERRVTLSGGETTIALAAGGY